MLSALVFAILAELALATSIDWSSLNSTLNGRLQVGIPFARSCFSVVGAGVAGSANQTECAQVQANYTAYDFRLDTFGSYMNTEWETCQATSEQCLLDYTNPANPAAFTAPQTCSQGSVPSYYVEVQTASDVQTVFAFAKQTKVDVVIKNTGHDYIGRSSGPGTLALWTHNLQSITLNKKWRPQGCYRVPGAAITIGAGVTHGMINDFALIHNITVPGGADATVGAAGGYLQGGGHSSVSNVYGLAVDRALEFEVVTPDGQHLIANECQNSDLFFALRGGGAGTFGVVLKATEIAYPQATFQDVVVTFQNIPSNVQAVLRFVIDQGLTWAQQGWGGYIIPQQGNAIVLTNPLVTPAQAAIQMAALQNFTKTINGTFTLGEQPSYPELFNNVIPHGVPVGLPYIMTSRLIPQGNFGTNQSRELLYERLLAVVEESDQPAILAVAPFKFNRTTGQTSVTPVWYESLWHVFSSKFWNFNETLAGRQAIYQKHSAAIQGLRDITPDSGAYANEADVHEPNYTTTFWGSNYDRLLSIKNKYDPDHLLDCWHCVGWKGANDERYKCYI